MNNMANWVKDENPMPNNHQFFQLLIATAIGFVAKILVEKAYLKVWSLRGR
jgi:hypothetical protein